MVIPGDRTASSLAPAATRTSAEFSGRKGSTRSPSSPRRTHGGATLLRISATELPEWVRWGKDSHTEVAYDIDFGGLRKKLARRMHA
jgi:hypothetical protein